ncbi:pentatricopeptide repeat-containing protein [Pyrus ussuriensis x Pyrus communis]|uniref:Pentatricopeptide repeat-containing protein n=1 Tax=Pyrus ussuriensis x Pyrus communis TaxID=2448454 RepID=A0A5N5FN50_9ROSA|nr:pentatricopeptide repeat-containing protein [Pyrus ussuriensis x Pyrus communis]
MENFTIPCKSNPPTAIIPPKFSNPSEFSPRQTKPTISFSRKTLPKSTDSHLNYLCKNGELTKAVTVLESIAKSGSKVTSTTYMNLLQSFEELNPFVETKLVSMYAKCGFLDDARKVFYAMRERNLYSWSAMIGACLRDQRWKEVVELFYSMMRDGVLPDYFLFPKILQACGNCRNLETTKLIHSIVVRCNLSSCIQVNNSILAVFFDNMDEKDGVSWNAIISGYCHKGETEEAQRLFDAMSKEGIEPGLVTWNTLIASHNQLGHCDVAMELMRRMESCGITPDKMLLAGVQPNGITITSAISACTSLKSLNKGLEIYSIAIKMGFIDDVLVGNALIGMFSKCGELEAAQKVFVRIPEKDVYTWNSMIGGYCQARYCGKAYELFMKMQESDVHPNAVTWNVMITGYMQSGDADQAMDLFQGMEKDGKVKRNTASWNSLVSGYLQLGEKDKALGVFRQMQAYCVNPNSVTILSVLPACANLVATKKVKEIHGSVLRRNLESVVPVANSLIDTYAKSGNIAYSRFIFDRMPSKDIITWNSLISGYVLHGLSDIALDLFDQLKKSGFKRNRGTFTSIIYAYSLAGMIDEGRQAFYSISENYQIIPGLEHYSAMVDLFGRSGRLQEAMQFIEDMPIEPDSSIWAALFTACRIHGNLALAVRAGEHLIDLEPGNILVQQLLLQSYSLCGKSEDTSKLKKFGRDAAIKKFIGQCWIEVKNSVHTYVAGDRLELCSNFLNSWLQNIEEKAKRHDFGNELCVEEEEGGISWVHSENLAFAFALIGSPSVPKSIRMVKNLRMCGNCHRMAKYISMAFGCEIYLSDSKSFHHFSNGRCSCGDYW